LVEALCYKPEGRGFESLWGSHNPSGLTVTMVATHPLTAMSTGNIFWVVKAAGV